MKSKYHPFISIFYALPLDNCRYIEYNIANLRGIIREKRKDSIMKPNYVAKKSVWAAITPLCVLFFWLVIPLLVMIWRMIANSYKIMEFYDDKIIVRSGVLNKSENSCIFAGVLAVSVNQSLFGRIFNYGDLKIDVQGKWDIDTTGIKNPKALKEYLETRIASPANLNFFGHQ